MTNFKKVKNTITIKKIKKSGLIDSVITEQLVNALKKDGLVVLPCDAIYGIICVANKKNELKLSKIFKDKKQNTERLVSSFKMLEDIAIIDKLEFDFLHRVWPGELVVYLKYKIDNEVFLPMRMPRSAYVLEIINILNEPLFYITATNPKGKHIYKKEDIYKKFKDDVDLILIIDEFCKDHSLPSVVNISNNELEIIHEGRIPDEEIKSLYFLGIDDPEE